MLTNTWSTGFMLCLTYLPKFLLGLVVNLSAYIVVPIALLFCNPQDTNLPKWASWYDEVDYGINGDPYWKGPEHADGKQNTYWWRLKWLLRNNSTTFASKVLGFNNTNFNNFVFVGDTETSDQPIFHEGTIVAEVSTTDGNNGKMFYGIKQISDTNYCFRMYIGYKLMSAVHNQIDELGNAKPIMFVYHFSIRPINKA